MPARSAPLTVVLRRRRSKLVHVSLWNTHTDRIESGSWFNGKVYPEKCDFSPDGRWFVYFAMGGNGKCWTGVSRPPFLHAEAYLPEGDTWGGGGSWLDSKRVCLSRDFKDEDLVVHGTRGNIQGLPVLVTSVVRENYAYEDARKNGRTGPPTHFSPRANPHTDPWTKVILSPGVDPESAALTADGELLIARAGTVERWSRKDVRAGKPGFSLDMEGFCPPWQESASVGKPRREG